MAMEVQRKTLTAVTIREARILPPKAENEYAYIDRIQNMFLA